MARRWQISSQQVFTWRREARSDRTTIPSGPAVPLIPAFVPVVTETAVASVAAPPPAIEVKLAGAVVRVGSGMDGATLTAVLRAVRASASGR